MIENFQRTMMCLCYKDDQPVPLSQVVNHNQYGDETQKSIQSEERYDYCRKKLRKEVVQENE